MKHLNEPVRRCSDGVTPTPPNEDVKRPLAIVDVDTIVALAVAA
jgi:hypothetical protein